jgi:hypothetical protein
MDECSFHPTNKQLEYIMQRNYELTKHPNEFRYKEVLDALA